MELADAEQYICKSKEIPGLKKNERPRLLSDKGSCSIVKKIKVVTGTELNGHVCLCSFIILRCKKKVECYQRTMK